MYNQLLTIILTNNQTYQELNDKIYQIKASDTESAAELVTAQQTYNQHLHDYATAISEFLWEHKQELRPYDLTALNLIPYNVWRKMKEKSSIIVETIEKLYHNE